MAQLRGTDRAVFDNLAALAKLGMALGRDMAGEAESAGSSPGYTGLTLFTALGCILAAYVYLGAPGVWNTPLAAHLVKVEPAQGWLPAAHFLFSAGMLGGGLWLAQILRALARPGVVPLVLFVVLQFGLLATALANLAVGIAALRFGGADAVAGVGFIFVALVALRVHPDLYMAILRYSSWVRSVQVSDHSPVMGGALIALTAGSNLVPLALTSQTLTTHTGAMIAALFRGAVIDPAAYWPSVAAQTANVTPWEMTLAAAAAAVSIGLGLFWSLARQSTVRRLAAAERVAQSLSAEQLRFVEDALPAVANAVTVRASSGRYIGWAFFWMFLVTPALLLSAYSAVMWFDVLQERHALSWVTVAASDFTAFASGELGWAQYVIPGALVLIAATMSAPFAQLAFNGAKYDQFAFGQPMSDMLRVQLYVGVKSDDIGPGRSFDPVAFAARVTRRVYWLRFVLAGVAISAAAASGFRDVARGVAFTGDGLIVQNHYFSPPKLIRYYEVQAVAVDCRIDPLGARPVFELSLPDGRVVDMVGGAPLNEKLDRYLAVNRRLQFSGVGYAYPPGDMEPCLKAIQQRYNSVIAAGTARLLHVLD